MTPAKKTRQPDPRPARRDFVINFLRSQGEDAPLDEGTLMVFIEEWEGRDKKVYP